MNVPTELVKRLKLCADYHGEALEAYVCDAVKAMVEGDEADIRSGYLSPPEWCEG